MKTSNGSRLGLVLSLTAAVAAAACGGESPSDNGSNAGTGGQSGAGSGGAAGATGGAAGAAGAAGAGAAGAGAAGAAGAGTCPPSTSSSDPVLQDLAQHFADNLAAVGVPGGSMAVVQDDTISIINVGTTSSQGTVCVDNDTMFSTAAVNQQLTNLAALTLIDDGEIKDSDAVATYVPELHTPSSSYGTAMDITVRDLLLERSGLHAGFWGNQLGSEGCSATSLEEYFTNNELELWYPPGSLRLVSELGTSLTGRLVETVTGKPYADAMEERVFKPLGMHATFDHDAAVNSGHLAAGLGGFYAPCAVAAPARGVYATAHDMGLFMRSLVSDNSSILQNTRDLVFDAGAENFVPESAHGYVMYLAAYSGEAQYAQNGGWADGYASFLGAAPAQHFAVAILSNGGFSSAVHDAMNDTSRYAMDRLINVQKAKLFDDATAPSTWSEYTGTYLDPIGIGNGPRTLQVRLDNGTLWADIHDPVADKSVQLTPFVDSVQDSYKDTFEVAGEGFTVRFWRDAADSPWAIGDWGEHFGPPAVRTTP